MFPSIFSIKAIAAFYVVCYSSVEVVRMLNTCAICEKAFEARRKDRKVCYEDHYKVCPICGKYFVCNDWRRYKTASCSLSCAGQTPRSTVMRICVVCGDEFETTNRNAKSCSKQHTRNCDVCGEEFNLFHPWTQRTCSPSCRGEYRKRSGIARQSTEKARQTVQERYGVNNVGKIFFKRGTCELCGKEFDATSNNQRYCADKHFHPCPICGDPVELLACEMGYTDKCCSAACTEQKRIITTTEKYGAPYAVISDHAKKLIKVTCLEKYGVDHPSKADTAIRKQMLNPDRYDAFSAFKMNPREYIKNNYKNKVSLSSLANDLGSSISSVSKYVTDAGCRDLIDLCTSTMEQAVISHLQVIVPGIRIIRNDRTIISPKEIDIYLPDYNLGIECNPTYTHNSSVGTAWDDRPKSRSYHQKKTEAAKSKGIFLFHIFGHEWKHRQEVIKSMLANLLGVNTQKVYARNCYVDEISASTARDFLDGNHLQGSLSAPIRLGLYHKQTHELLSVMTFGKLRKSMGTNTVSPDGVFELSRFCTLIGTNVIGGASKLFKAFIRDYQPDQVISFSDEAHTRGGLYETLGFINNTSPSLGYVWVDPVDDSYHTRVACQKRNLRTLLNDETLDIQNQSERDIMTSFGYVQVFDAGRRKWVWSAD